MKFNIKAASDPGLKRNHNEDMILVGTDLLRDDNLEVELDRDLHNSPLLLAVSDGMGGHSAGDVASLTVLRELAVAMNGLAGNLDFEKLKDYFTETIKEIHSGLVEQAKLDSAKKGMGATLIAILFYADKIFYINAGDSRLYRFRRGILKQISKDHSLAEAAGYDRGTTHVLLNSVGGGQKVDVDFFDITESVISGDIFLLCSDGLTDLVDDETIEKILDVNPEPFVLVNEAKKNGGLDNISTILAEVVFSEQNSENKNEFLALLNKEREGLSQVDNFVVSEYIRINEMELQYTRVTKNISGDEATIEVYTKDDKKIVISTVVHETASEGDLNFTTSYGNIE